MANDHQARTGDYDEQLGNIQDADEHIKEVINVIEAQLIDIADKSLTTEKIEKGMI